MISQIAAAGYLLLLGLVWGLLRYEFGMPRIVSAAFGGTVITVGVLAAALAQLAGLGSMSGFTGIVTSIVVSAGLLLSVVA